jgi:hypothetical protein
LDLWSSSNAGSTAFQCKKSHFTKNPKCKHWQSKVEAVKFRVLVHYLMMAKKPKHVIVNISIQKVVLMEINTTENTIFRRQYI